MKSPDDLGTESASDFLESVAWCCVINNCCLGIGLWVAGIWEGSAAHRQSYLRAFYPWWGTMHVLLGFHLVLGAVLRCGWVVTFTVWGALGGEVVLGFTSSPIEFLDDLDARMPYLVSGALIGCVLGFSIDQFLAWMKSRQVGSISETDTAP